MSGKFSPWAERFPEVVREVSHRPPFLTEKDGNCPFSSILRETNPLVLSEYRSYTPLLDTIVSIVPAKRSMLIQLPLVQGTEHSGIALLCPTKGPKFYLERAVGDVLSHRPSDGIELNRFYTSEAFQKKLLHGAETWQLATLNKHLFISSELPLFPGGHRASDDPTLFLEAFAANRMAANPDEWFNFLHKSRWYDLASSSTLDGSSDNETMSVDHPGVWDNLRGSIDLLDKILKALIVDRHNGFEGMLYGRISHWVDVSQYTPIRPPHDIALVLFTPEMERKIAIMEKGTPYRNELYGLMEEQRITAMAQRLTHLLQLHTWSFAPMDVGSGITKRAYPENNWSSLTVVSKEAVQELLGDDITLAERFIIQFDLTTTLLHEIMHAIISVRTNEAGIDYKLPEPLIDFDPIAEIGEAMEKRIFGGRYIMTPSLGVPLGTVLHEWPTLGTGGMINGKDPFWRKKAEDIKQLFSVLYISKLFSAEFWDNIYAPGKTATRFWQSTLFKNYQLDEANKRNWDGEERAVAEAYRATRYERDRYQDEALAKYQEAWRHTPWGVCNWEFLTSFTKNFKNDEYACYVACSQTRMCDWFSVERFITSMPRSDGLLSNWVPFSVGMCTTATTRSIESMNEAPL
ncbi:hypothetical protein NPX13_g10394 [Xylaria arbuscula]|uniref:Uncharacterized protein n=1 Tax=Xylaria arbuscula TaxID=114810 RepID=A0A9W8N553_9PEZI|nr:hypothetical protein NPX13_g10394 [Xylaria arbuscula]